MATKLLKPKLYLVIFLSVLCHFGSPSILNHHHSLPKPQKIVQTGKFVQSNQNYPFRTTFIQTGETKPVAELDWRLDGQASLVEFRLRTAVIQRDKAATEWIAFGMSSNGSLIDADLIVVWLHGNKIEFKVRCSGMMLCLMTMAFYMTWIMSVMLVYMISCLLLLFFFILLSLSFKG